MNIEQVELYHLAMRLVSPFRTSFGEEHDRHCLLIRVDTEGLSGWGECVAGAWPGYSYETAQTAWHVMEAFFIPTLFQAPVEDIKEYRRRLQPFRGHPLARAGLELALWDALARAAAQPLHALLGGAATSVEVGVSIGIQEDVGTLLRVVGEFVSRGYRRVKIKIAPGWDLEPVSAVRQAFPELPLQVDANSAYALTEAPIFKAMDDLDLLLIEQPLAEDDLIDHSQLQSRLRTPICLDESIRSLRHARQALDIGACRVVNIKPARVGGLQEAVDIHDYCRNKGVPVWCGGMLETGVGRAANLALASLPGFTLPGDISATDRYYEQDIAWPRFDLEQGKLRVPQAAGLGVEVDEQAVERFTLRRQRFRPGDTP